jgi:glycosyltransferase involved in cell wall biosynthesis
MPVVANRAGIQEVVHDGVNGYLVDPGDVDDLLQRYASATSVA